MCRQCKTCVNWMWMSSISNLISPLITYMFLSSRSQSAFSSTRITEAQPKDEISFNNWCGIYMLVLLVNYLAFWYICRCWMVVLYVNKSSVTSSSYYQCQTLVLWVIDFQNRPSNVTNALVKSHIVAYSSWLQQTETAFRAAHSQGIKIGQLLFFFIIFICIWIPMVTIHVRVIFEVLP